MAPSLLRPFRKRTPRPGRAYALGKDLLGYQGPDTGLVDSPRAVDDTNGPFWFCISSSCIDRDGDVVEPKGIRFDNWKKNGAPIHWNHQESPHGLPVGTALSPGSGELLLKVEPNRVLAGIHFDTSPFAQELKRLVKKGLIRNTSIGFVPLEVKRLQRSDKAAPGRRNSAVERFRIAECDLLEVSIVGVGANPEALAQELGKGYSAAMYKALGLRRPKRSTALPSGGVTPNEWRVRQGKKPYQSGDPLAPTGPVVKLPSSQGVPAPTPAEDGPTGSDIHQLVLAKDRFPAAEDARAWVEAQGYDGSTPASEAGHWTFEQFPADELLEGELREEALADGVMAVMGRRRAAPPAADPAKEPMDGEVEGERMDDDEKEKPGKGKSLPPGAAFLAGLIGQLEAAAESIRQALPLQERPETVATAKGVDAVLALLVESVRGDAAGAYPGYDFADAADSAPGAKRCRTGELLARLEGQASPAAADESEPPAALKGLDAGAILTQIRELREQLAANEQSLYRVTG